MDFLLVMLIEAHVPNVWPGCRQMAAIALADLGMRLSRHFRREHFEVLHVMARRGLMALSAISRPWCGMGKAGNVPAGCCVTVHAIVAEEREVGILIAVARAAVE